MTVRFKDQFDRIIAPGEDLGTPTSGGGAYVEFDNPGPASGTVEVTGAAAIFTINDSPVSENEWSFGSTLTSPISAAPFDVTGEVSFESGKPSFDILAGSGIASCGLQFGWVYTDPGPPLGSIFLNSNITTGAALRTFVLGTHYSYRLRYDGSRLRCRVWATSVSEPTTWDIDLAGFTGWAVVLDELDVVLTDQNFLHADYPISHGSSAKIYSAYVTARSVSTGGGHGAAGGDSTSAGGDDGHGGDENPNGYLSRVYFYEAFAG